MLRDHECCVLFWRHVTHLRSLHLWEDCNLKICCLGFSVSVAFHKIIYYMEKSVLLGTKPLVDSMRHFIRDPSGIFSVCHLCECRIVQWSHDSRLLLLLNWFLHIIKRTLHVEPPCNILYIFTANRIIKFRILVGIIRLTYFIALCKGGWALNFRWTISCAA